MAIDGRRLQDDPPGGVGRAIRGLLPPLAQRCRTTVLTDASRPAPAVPDGVEVVPLARPRGLPEAAWLHHAARRWARRHPHVFHGTFNAVPFGLEGASVVTIWDLSFEIHPEDFATPRRRLVRQWFRLAARYAARHADRVVTGSRYSADLLAEHYGIRSDRLVTIPIAPDPAFAPDAAVRRADVARRHGIGARHLVAVGGAPRRGAEVAVEVWRTLRSTGHDLDLVVLGEVAHVPAAGLHVLHGVPDHDWAALLAGAEALLYPTRYEGFGLPGLEAMACGTPVIAAHGSSLDEVLGDGAAWCDAPTAGAMLPVLAELLVDQRRHRARRDAGLAHAAAWPSWDDIAARHEELYRAVG